MRTTARALVPEGWAFFTRSPREEQATVWGLAAGGSRFHERGLGPYAQPANGFGWNREARALNLEIGILQTAVSDRWAPCPGGDVSACLQREPALAIRNEAPEPLLCGSVGISLREPVPWAWAEGQDPNGMPTRVARLDVSC
ncbi:SdpA family antimicrobial peptide system protein [Streptomyces sp. NPDC092307]|uniref:SdpA family antimicrobial peptide system protein n=1 Tax=Streptomyces sp. NPDC092307 TaxID=3366013 RepID=UPI003810BF5B